MRAIIIKDKNTVAVEEREAPHAGPGQVRVAVARCGICGSDLHAYSGAWKPGPNAPGHEYVGVVDEVGEGVRGVEPGRRVTVQAFGHCGRCAMCREGRFGLCEHLAWLGSECHGGLGEFATAPAAAVLSAPNDLSDREAALLEPAAVGWHAAARFGRTGFQRVLVIGGGTIGLMSLCAAKALGAGRTAIITKYDHQSEAARALGADAVLQAGKADARKAVRDALGGGADLVIDSVAAGSSVSTALDAAAAGGRVVLAGGVTRPLLTMFGPLVGREITLTGSNCYGLCDGRHDFDWAADMLRARPEIGRILVTHELPLADAARAFETAADKKSGSIKVHVVMR